MELTLRRCHMREWNVEDVAVLPRIADDRAIWRNLRDRFPHPYTRAHAERWIAHANSADPVTQFAIEVEGALVGGIGLELGEDVHRRTAEIGFWLTPAVHGRGIATEAVRCLTAWGFDSLDLDRIWAGVFDWNPASARVLEKAGYQFEGRLRAAVFKDGHVVDQLIYAITS